jgi:putative phosphoesterase
MGGRSVIGVMSDSHDNLPAIRRAISVFNDAHCNLVLHAGDIVAPFAIKELAALDCRVQAVYGNCDGEKPGLAAAVEPFGEIRDAPAVFSHDKREILLGHVNFPVPEYVASGKYDIVVFGHTHKPEVIKKGRTLAVNPGETGGWLTGKSTVALLDPATLEAEIIEL